MNENIISALMLELDSISANFNFRTHHYIYSEKNIEIEYVTDNMQYFIYAQNCITRVITENDTLTDGLTIQYDKGKNWNGITIAQKPNNINISLFYQKD